MPPLRIKFHKIREMQNENKMSAAAYIRAYRPWHSLYNVRLRLETNTGGDVSSCSFDPSLFKNPGLDSVHRQQASLTLLIGSL